MLSFMRLSVAVAVLAPALSAYASNILVLVGANNQLAFSPSNVTANVGDTVTFQFQSKNHSVTQSSFASPCTPLAGGVDSGFQFVAANAANIPEFSLTISNASKPLFFFSKQDAVVNECQKGMVFSINADPNSAKSFAAFQAAAEASAAPAASSSASSGSNILVLVGANNQLAFSPSNVTANAGDTVTFQFQSKNHSVTQSSFASPCTPLVGGVDSGFQFVAANAADIPEFSLTISDASKPLFFFSKQDAVVNECQKGMVFSINADPNSAESFAAFQAAAEESAASSSSAPTAGASSGSEILVLVGQNNQLTFSPSNITANAGDTVTFQFQSKNHSVTQSSFEAPCTPLAGGVDSGFQFIAANATALPEFSFTINNAAKPLFFFSKQDAVVNECQKGMVFSINADPNSAESFAAFQAAAEESAASSSSAPAAGASSGSEILVLVGQNNQLTFSPSNITANVGDTVTFQFQSKNHSVTQSSFASPCTPLLGGVDSGFQAVTPDATAFPEFSFTLNNASTPLFFFSKQDALVSECQKGMVFSINANPDSAKSFAAFQANAEASVAPSAKASKKFQRKHSRDFASAAKVARK